MGSFQSIFNSSTQSTQTEVPTIGCGVGIGVPNGQQVAPLPNYPLDGDDLSDYIKPTDNKNEKSFEDVRDDLIRESLKIEFRKEAVKNYESSDKGWDVDDESFAAYSEWRDKYAKEHNGATPTKDEILGAMNYKFDEYQASGYEAMYKDYSSRCALMEKAMSGKIGFADILQNPGLQDMQKRVKDMGSLVDEASYGVRSISTLGNYSSRSVDERMAGADRWAVVFEAYGKYAEANPGMTIKGRMDEITPAIKAIIELRLAAEERDKIHTWEPTLKNTIKDVGQQVQTQSDKLYGGEITTAMKAAEMFKSASADGMSVLQKNQLEDMTNIADAFRSIGKLESMDLDAAQKQVESLYASKADLVKDFQAITEAARGSDGIVDKSKFLEGMRGAYGQKAPYFMEAVETVVGGLNAADKLTNGRDAASILGMEAEATASSRHSQAVEAFGLQAVTAPAQSSQEKALAELQA